MEHSWMNMPLEEAMYMGAKYKDGRFKVRFLRSARPVVSTMDSGCYQDPFAAEKPVAKRRKKKIERNAKKGKRAVGQGHWGIERHEYSPKAKRTRKVILSKRTETVGTTSFRAETEKPKVGEYKRGVRVKKPSNVGTGMEEAFVLGLQRVAMDNMTPGTDRSKKIEMVKDTFFRRGWRNGAPPSPAERKANAKQQQRTNKKRKARRSA